MKVKMYYTRTDQARPVAPRSGSLFGTETKLHTKSVHAPEKRVVLGVFEPSENSCDGRLRKFPKNDVVVSRTPIQ